MRLLGRLDFIPDSYLNGASSQIFYQTSRALREEAVSKALQDRLYEAPVNRCEK